MSLSRLSGRLNLFLSLNRNHHYPLPTSRNQLEIVVSKDRNLGALDIRYGQLFDFGCRGFTSRCDLNKSAIDNCKGLSLLRGQNTARSWQMLNLRHHYASQATTATEKKSKKMLYYLTGLVFAMVGASYAAVPLYRRFCQATGYGGTVQRRESVEEKIARHAKDGRVASREIAVQFNADVADGMPWKFIPTQREVKVKPGESALAFYTAENRSSAPITGVSTYNVTPMKYLGTLFQLVLLLNYKRQVRAVDPKWGCPFKGHCHLLLVAPKQR
ncbi:cytochrome c oxidase assembly protein COX11, mitochondrial-like isoform X2 [Lycium ferocissimum]|uniref:cytochrome c oxidase assembly protein COX11, mitochondrial-like isoform X2 n=1 Tax=Lycium ferocissimum TaxID=112874 RepID=UPI0028163427|nr:cytochrome c oxidase assembly protein COX11, mitochondrial-like isoform X2 [Lycium ferocissimum]